MLATFCLRLAVGLLVGLLILPPGSVAPRFHRIQMLIVIGLLAGAAFAWDAQALSFLQPAPELVCENLTSAGLLGCVVTAMLLGHWYLIAPNMTITPLLRLLKASFVLLALRTLVVGWRGLELSISQLDNTTWIWGALRVIAGIAGVAVLTWMALVCARIRSTRAATGILYIAVVFVFIGEALDLLIQSHQRESYL